MVNIIIENIIFQVDDRGWYTRILEEMLSFRCDPGVVVPKGEQAYKNVNGIQCPVITKNCWDVQVKWIDQSTGWVCLHMIKESNPIEVAEHDMAHC